MKDENIIIKGARVNNLKNISVEIPRGKFVVITGLSGSGKSSLAFDTLYAEGQRRYAESLSSYARQFLGRMSKPDVDAIEGIPPAIAIEQRVNIRNPRSTVATTTEIYDYVRLIFARIGRTFSPVSGKQVHIDNNTSVMKAMLEKKPSAAYILSDIGWDGREDRVEMLLNLKSLGYTRLFTCGTIHTIEEVLQEDCKREGLMLLVDRVRFNEDHQIGDDMRTRLLASIQDAFDRGSGKMKIFFIFPDGTDSTEDFCNRFEADGIVFRQCDEYLFSFNSPAGACPVCGGLGRVDGISEDLVIPDKSKSIYDGAVAPWRGEKMGQFHDRMCRYGHKYGLDAFKPYCQLTQKQKDIVWKGAGDENSPECIIGLDEFFRWVETQKYKIQYKYMLSRFSGRTTCPECGGSRIRREALWVKVGGLNIMEVLAMTIDQAFTFFSTLDLSEYEKSIASKAIGEILDRLGYLKDVGLQYLTLDRASNTLSGGESQRINLVTALGSCLVGSMYILDEPSIGLHPRDTARLIKVLKRLRDIGNTVIVVEHDEEIMRAADEIIDLGPGAGTDGGQIAYHGRVTAEPKAGSLTLDYLNGRIERYSRRKITPTEFIRIEGAQEHNLKNIDVDIPLGCLVAVTGVSGSGKSTLVGEVLAPALLRHFEVPGPVPGTHRTLSGSIGRISQVEYVDQNPIGRNSRSNAVTYLKIYDDIRKLLSEQQYAKISGYTPSFFSFNQDGGRCPECQGEGVIRIPMQFMSDVTMVCEACGGKRFKADILQVRYREKNVDDILAMSVDQAIEFFAADNCLLARSIVSKLQYIKDVGLGYIKLGQSSSTLSGGESQRIKLAYFLSMSSDSRSKRILFIFDEPTTGLHFKDVETLLSCFDKLISKGHSVLVVEHNTIVIRAADYVIDLGPDAGEDGGRVVYCGPPENMPQDTFTGKYLFNTI